MRKNIRIRDTVSLAGWLFADLLLALSMLFLVFNSVVTQAPPTLSSPAPTAGRQRIGASTPSPEVRSTPVPKVTSTARVGLDLTPGLDVIYVDAPKTLAGDLDEIDSLRSLIRYKFSSFEGRHAGLVITLGFHHDIRSGVRLARIANEQLREVYPEMFSDAVMKSFWWSLDESNPIGTIKLEVYFLTVIGDR